MTPILVMGVALSLTVTRTAFITLGLLLGLAAACCLLAGLRKQGKLKEWMIRALCILLVLVLIVVGYLGMNKTIELFNAAKISLRAGAEEVSAPTPVPVKTVIQRPLDSGSSVLSNREHAWIAVFKLLTQKPIYLLTGASIVDPMTEVNPLTGMNFEYIHVHNIYLQILLECGIPGFLIMVAFLWIFVRAALKLLLGKDIPMWKRLLPILPITVLTAEMVESLTLLSSNWPALPFMMLFMGLTVRFSEDPKDLLVKE